VFGHKWVFGLSLLLSFAGLVAQVQIPTLMRRTIVYEHLTKLSFSSYDRAQSGHLISRANSDIRSVQTDLTFGPSIIVQWAIAPVAFIEMLTINVPLALVAMATMPFLRNSQMTRNRQMTRKRRQR
jgi:ATP-binding cassette, subfamily B, bacterial